MIQRLPTAWVVWKVPFHHCGRHGVESVRSEVLRLCDEIGCCVVDHPGQRPVRLPDLVDRSLDCGVVLDVDCLEVHLPGSILHRMVARFFEHRLASAPEVHMSTVLGQMSGDASTQTCASSGDEDSLTGKDITAER